MAVYRDMDGKNKVEKILKHLISDNSVSFIDLRTASCDQGDTAFMGIYGMMSSLCIVESSVYLCFEI